MVAEMQAAVDALSKGVSKARKRFTSDVLIVNFSIFRVFDYKSTTLTPPTSYQHWIQNGS